MRKKVLITVAAIFFIALNATVFTDAAKTSTVTLSSIFKSAYADNEMTPLEPKNPKQTGYKWCGSGFAQYQVPTCGSEGNGCVTTDC